MANIEKWLNHQFSTGVTPGEDYLQFQKDARADLKKQANASGFDLHQFKKNHYEFSAVLRHRDTGKFIYISISDVRFFPARWYDKVLIRTMAHDKDWTGGFNNYCRWYEIGRYALYLVEKGA